MIIFENIIPKADGTRETVGVSKEISGQYYRAILSALINSSNMGVNADRGQDFGWRLQPEQQALIEIWESDPEMIDKVSNYTKVPLDNLTHTEFLSYLLYQQELGKNPEKNDAATRREAQLDYERRVEALRSAATPEPVAAFTAPKTELTVEDFLDGNIEGQSKEVQNEEMSAPAEVPSLEQPEAPVAPESPATKKSKK